MPDFAQLYEELVCPACRQTMQFRFISFFWGMLPYAGYSIGDKIKWLRDRSGSPLPSFTIFPKLHYFNYGDPAVENLLVLEQFSDREGFSYECDKCGATFDAVGVQIENSTIVRVIPFLPSQVESFVRHPWKGEFLFEKLPDGSYFPRSDWTDPPFSVSN